MLTPLALLLIQSPLPGGPTAPSYRPIASPQTGTTGHQIGTAWTPVGRFEWSGGTVHDLRRVGPDGRVERRAVDAFGAELDLCALRLGASREAHLARGKLTPLLADHLRGLAPDQTAGVALWFADPAADAGGSRKVDSGRLVREAALSGPSDTAGERIRAARRAVAALEAERHGPRQAALGTLATALGAEVLPVPPEWPFLLVRANGDAIRELAAHPAVASAYLLSDQWAPEGDFAQGTLRSEPLFDAGIEANGSVRVLVNDTAQVQLNNPYLPPIIALNGSSAGSHATGVAGNIANRHPQHRALAAALPVLYSAGGTGDSVAPGIWSNAIQEGIDMGNCSWWNFQSGSIQFLDRFFDHTIRTYSVMLFKSNGNQGSTSAPFATTPGNGYNMVSVGAYSDQDNVLWPDDAMASTSSYANPVEGHEKPEVASPGTCVTTTGLGSGGLQVCFGGTSSASPLVAGLGALLLSQDNALLGQMTTLKAVLMASAWHNVESAPLLSDRDGAGSVHAMAAVQTVRRGQYWHEEVTSADFPGNLLDVPIPLVAGQSARVVALWQSRVDGALTTDVLDMDVDMVVLDPNGVPIASSASATNPFEIAGFNAAQSGTYTARLSLQRFQGTSEPLSVVWSTQNDAGHAEVIYATGTPAIQVGSRPIFRFRDRYTGAGKVYQAIASTSATPTGTPVLSGGYILPVGFDAFGAYSTTLPGFGGTFNANGSTRASLLIPPDPGLAGLGLHLALVVFQPGGTVETVSQPADFVIAP